MTFFFFKDNNGIKEMIVAYSDRKIHIYRWYITNHAGIAAFSNSYNYSLQDVGKFVLQQSWELEQQVK